MAAVTRAVAFAAGLLISVAALLIVTGDGTVREWVAEMFELVGYLVVSVVAAGLIGWAVIGWANGRDW